MLDLANYGIAEVTAAIQTCYGRQLAWDGVGIAGMGFAMFCMQQSQAPGVVMTTARWGMEIIVLMGLYCIVMMMMPSLSPLLRRHGDAFTLAAKIRAGSDSIIYRDSHVIVTRYYVMLESKHTDYLKSFVPLEDIRLYFGFYNDADPSERCMIIWDRHACERRYPCPNPWEVCAILEPYVPWEARYSESDSDIREIMEEIRAAARHK